MFRRSGRQYDDGYDNGRHKIARALIHLFEGLDKYLRTVYVVWVQQNGKNCTGVQGNNVKPDLSGKLQ